MGKVPIRPSREDRPDICAARAAQMFSRLDGRKHEKERHEKLCQPLGLYSCLRRLGGRLCRYNRRSCCFGRFVLCAARAHRHKRKRKHKRQHGLFHILYSLHTLCCRSFRHPQPQDHITVSVMLRSASKPYSPLYPPSGKKAIFSENCLDDFMYHSQLRHNFPSRRAFANASFT